MLRSKNNAAGPRRPASTWLAYGLAVASSIAAVGLRMALQEQFGDAYPFIFSFGAVALTATYGGWGPGLVAIVTSYLANEWLLIPPLFQLSLATANDWVRLAGFFFTTSLIVILADAMRRARANLFAERDQLHVTLASIGDAVIATDTSARVTFINPVAQHLTGWPASEALGQPLTVVFRVVHEGAAVPIQNPVEKVLESGQVVELANHTLLIARNGTEIAIADTASPIRDEEQRIKGAVLVFRDVTEERRIAQTLRESEARFRQLAEAMPQLVWTARSDGAVDYYNGRLAAFAGASRQGEGPWKWEQMVHLDDRERTLNNWKHAVGRGTIYVETHRLCMATGEHRWHLTRAVPVRDTEGRVVKWLGTATDIDDQKRVEERLEQAVVERTAQLRETIGELEAFTYSVAHDMRAPLRSMRGYAEILTDEHAEQLDREGREYLQRIAVSAERLDRLIQDVLTYSKLVPNQFELEPLDPAQLVRELIHTYPNLQAAEISIHEPLLRVRANKAALTQVISNLLGNAVKFVGPGVQPRIVVRSEERGDFVRLWFEDNGIGIPRSFQTRIFQIFQRLHAPAEYEGTGIGLAIVEKATHRMGGRVGVESEPGQGSQFWVELLKDPGPDKAPMEPAMELPAHGPEKPGVHP